jgi:hypothetical protein
MDLNSPDLDELFPIDPEKLSEIEVDDETAARIRRKLEIRMLATNKRFLEALGLEAE